MTSFPLKNLRLQLSACVFALASATSLIGSTVYINFGGQADDAGWNTINPGVEVDSPVALIDSTGAASALSLTITQPFNGLNNNGHTGGHGDFPASVTANSLFGNDVEFSGNVRPNPAFEIAGLDPAASYDLTFYGSRLGVTDVRTGLYTATGANTVTGVYDAGNNVDQVLVLEDITPTAGGVITVDVVKDATNTNSYGFVYVGGLILESDDGAAGGDTWGGFPIVDNHVDTGDWFGWFMIYPGGDWVYLYELSNFAYFPDPGADAPGGWAWIPRP